MKILSLNYPKIYTNNYFSSNKKNNSINCSNSQELSKVNSEILKANYLQPAFTSLERSDVNTGVPLHSGFYRDVPTLVESVSLIENEFPNGTTILDGACSTGEELISIYSLISKNREKYNFIGFDLSDDALNIANKNIYSVIQDFGDAFLINSKCSAKENELKRNFYEVMVKTAKPDFQLNHFALERLEDLDVDYFRMSDEHRKNINFQKSDINEIDTFQPDREVGAIFFRNALYMMVNNSLHKGLYDKNYANEQDINRAEILGSLVDKIYDRLASRGIFVLGEIPAEHVYFADKNTPRNNRVMIDNIPMFDQHIDYYMADPEVEVCKVAPIYNSLLKNNRFRPVFSTNTSFDGYNLRVPTIWQKVQ